ncbi:hypothetical protein [Streptomyces cucumeris]|uniref:hypothetical protein n=1 Tax=Streptomyces cucumeris TaxID=2962890 RepID=UPI003D70C65E
MTPDEAALVITNYYFAPAEGEQWQVTPERFAQEAEDRWPNCTTNTAASEVSTGLEVEFAMTFSNEAERHGAYNPSHGLSLYGHTALDAAEFMSWFVTMLEPDLRVLFNNAESIESGDYDDHVLPRSMGVRPMAEALATHLAGALLEE